MLSPLAPVFMACAFSAGPPLYTLQQLGPPPAAYTFMDAYGIGPQGQILGRVYNNNVSPPTRRGFVWHNGTMTFLDGPPGTTRTEAWCMDEAGVIYGGYDDVRFDPIFAKMLPARWVGGVPQPFANNPSINSATIFGCAPTSGVAVGWAAPYVPNAPGWNGEYGYFGEPPFNENDAVRAFAWSSGSNEGGVIDRWFGLGDEGARDVNDAGQIALNLFAWEMGGAAIFDPRFGVGRLPMLGATLPNSGWGSFVFAINAAGEIVGRSQAAGGLEHPVRWANGAVIDLGLLPGTLEGEARDIDDAGTVVGALSSQNNPFGVTPTMGFIVIDGVMHNLNTLTPGAGVTIVAGIALNTSGQILVDLTPPATSGRRFGLLTPAP